MAAAQDIRFDNDESELSIYDVAQVRWLNAEEIISLLSGIDNERIELATGPPLSPPKSGTMLIYDRLSVRDYKADGHEWIRKKSNPKKIREDHVKLRCKGQDRIRGNYVHSAEIKTLHRRAYTLIETDEEKEAYNESPHRYQQLVLVHYLDTEEATKISTKAPANMNASRGQNRSRSTGFNNDELVHSYNPIPIASGSTGVRTANSYEQMLDQMSARSGSAHYYGHDLKFGGF